MPKVEIGHVYGIYVKAEASEASVDELFAKARTEFENAVKLVAGDPPGPAGDPPGPAGGIHTETRWFPAHSDTHYNGVAGFAPVKAGGE